MMMFKMVMVMLVVDIVFKTATLAPNVDIQVPLRINMGALLRVMLVVDMVS